MPVRISYREKGIFSPLIRYNKCYNHVIKDNFETVEINYDRLIRGRLVRTNLVLVKQNILGYAIIEEKDIE